jgi:hypothetical protein
MVDLLEEIQTLFREAWVIFVVAADRHWLTAYYEEAYENLCPRISEPGKPLGYLFLEKACIRPSRCIRQERVTARPRLTVDPETCV